MKEREPINRVQFRLFIEDNEQLLRQGPYQMHSGYNLFICHQKAPKNGFTITGDPITFVVDDITGRKETFFLLTRDDFLTSAV